MEQTEKKNAERYLVIDRNGNSTTVWAEDFTDVLKELDESLEAEETAFSKDDVKMIMVLD